MRNIAITSNSFFTLIMQARLTALDHNLNREETYDHFCALYRQATYIQQEPIGQDEDILF